MWSDIKKPIFSAIIFFSTLGVISIGYSAYNALSPVNTGDPLTKTIWNQMVSNIADLDSRIDSLATSSGSLWTANGSDISYSAGNVGIGTASPEKQLHVKSSAGNAEIDIQSDSKDKWAIYHDELSEDLRFWNLSNILTLQKNGNVGIGTSAPGPMFEVNGPHTSGKGLIYANGTNHGYFMANAPSTGEAGISIKNNGGLGWHIYRPANSSDLRFFDEVATKDVMTMKPGGKIGIGTTTPWAKMTIAGSGTLGASLDVVNNNDASGENSFIRSYVQGANSGNPVFRAVVNGFTEWAWGIDNADDDKFKISNSGEVGNSSDKMTIQTNGNVGIGTVNPALRLHVVGNAKIQSTSSSQAYATFAGTAGTVGWFGTSANGGLSSGIAEGDIVARGQGASIHIATDAGPALTATTAGKVGIGTTVPLANLEVRGNVRASWAQGARYGMEFWSVSSLNGTSCNTSCNNGYCIGGYIDDDTNTKVSCTVTTSNRNCACIGRP